MWKKFCCSVWNHSQSLTDYNFLALCPTETHSTSEKIYFSLPNNSAGWEFYYYKFKFFSWKSQNLISVQVGKFLKFDKVCCTIIWETKVQHSSCSLRKKSNNSKALPWLVHSSWIIEKPCSDFAISKRRPTRIRLPLQKTLFM